MRRYSFIIMAGVFGLLVLIAGFNWFINPYDIFVSHVIKGVNDYKIEVTRHARLSKVYQVERIAPDSLLLASSKGMVVPVSYFTDEGMTGFNNALLGASTYELLRMLQHAQSVRPLKRVVLALDEEFSVSKAPYFSEDRELVNVDGSVNTGRPLRKINDMFESLLGLHAVRSSSRTIRKQALSPDNVGDYKYQLNKIAEVGGHHQMFRNREAVIFNIGKKQLLPQKCLSLSKDAVEIDLKAAAYFDDIVNLAYENNIDLYIYFGPVHARYYETMCMAGEWWKIEAMKRYAVSVVDRAAKKYNKNVFPVWDFSGYNEVTKENVPLPGDKDTLMKWYWDDSHYTKETARLIFDRMFLREKKDGFGNMLTVENIDNHLSRLRRERSEYIDKHPQDMSELVEIMGKSTEKSLL